MAKAAITSVDDYISAQRPSVQGALRRVRATIRKALPTAAESILYGMPAYRIGGKRVVQFAAWSKHIALPLDEPLPLTLIGRIVKHRAEEVARSKK